MKATILILMLFAFVMFIGGCSAKEIEGNCVLLKHSETGELGCFGCAGRTCIDPAPGMEPTADNSARCIATSDGCRLAR